MRILSGNGEKLHSVQIECSLKHVFLWESQGELLSENEV